MKDKLPKPTQEETETLNSPVSVKVIKCLIVKNPQTTCWAQMASLLKSTKHLRKKSNSTQTLPEKIKRKEYFPTNFMMLPLPCKPKTVQKKNIDANNSSKKFVK